jgi:DNA modification methylase
MKKYQVTMSEEQYKDYLEYLTNPVNVQDVKKPNSKVEAPGSTHPCLKPEKLMEWLVKLLSKEGDHVMDIFCGSGTTGAAAVKLNRNFIGIDKSKEYCEYTEKRLNNVKVD